MFSVAPLIVILIYILIISFLVYFLVKVLRYMKRKSDNDSLLIQKIDELSKNLSEFKKDK